MRVDHSNPRAALRAGVLLIGAALISAGCDTRSLLGPPLIDGGVDSGTPDAGPPDAGADAGPMDGGPPDAGPDDAGADAGPVDGAVDAAVDGAVDAAVDGAVDGGAMDGAVDGAVDGGPPADAGDAGDAGPLCPLPTESATCAGSDGCIVWALVSTVVSPADEVTFTWEVANTCGEGLDRVSFLFEPTAASIDPVDGSTYTTPGGADYTVDVVGAGEDACGVGYAFVGAPPTVAATQRFIFTMNNADITADTRLLQRVDTVGGASLSYFTLASRCYTP